MMMMILRRLILAFSGLFFLLLNVNPWYSREAFLPEELPRDPSFLTADSAWVDSLMKEMDLEQKIAQMLMVPVYSDKGEDHVKELEKLVKKYGIGGLIVFTGGPVRQANITNHLQQISDIPLLMAIDGEWGLEMRMDSVIKYPRQMLLGAIQNDSLLYKLGYDIACQMREMGIHMNFSPVADINNNPANPVINTRSFGEDRDNVSNKLIAMFSGMQDGGLLVTAKHFPGHGDTETDSHYDLPVIPYSWERLDSIELYPFKKAIPRGLSGIMIAHLNMPELDSTLNTPATLSNRIVTGLLQEAYEFKGLVVTDAMTMEGVSKYHRPGQAEMRAVEAGNDIILMPSDVPKAISCIKKAVARGEVQIESIDQSCRKILLAKSWLGLREKPVIKTEGLIERLNDRKYYPLKHAIIENSLTLVRNRGDLIPFDHLEKRKIATINLGVKNRTVLTERLDQYLEGTHFYYEKPSDFPEDTTLEKALDPFNTLLINLYYTRSFGNNFNIPEEVPSFINSIDFKGDIVLNLMGYPYALGVLGDLDNMDAILLSYTKEELNQDYAAQGLFGAVSFRGRLPVSVGEKYPLATGYITPGGLRLRYGLPEQVGLKMDSLKRIDDIISRAILDKATPGCQLLIARNGNVVWNKSYGYHTYRKRREVRNTDIYDLASITKIASTIPSLMLLKDRGLFSVDSMLGAYVPELDTSAKAKLNIRDILTHQSGLTAWIPFYMETIEPLDTSQSIFAASYSYTYPYRIGPNAFANRNVVYRDSVYKNTFSAQYPVQVAENLFMNSAYRDSVYKAIVSSELGEKVYKYSDLGYYYLYRVVEDLTDTLFYPFNWYHFYGPLGAATMGFLPLNRYEKDRIIPTENDLLFRKQLVHGYVHDPGAAMLGGICGHAGLFSNANDLAKLMQMYLDYGLYGGKRYIDSATIAEFSSVQFPETDNRRGLGFDRPITEEEDAGPACNSASASSYGHTGFTGTIAWVDPRYDLLYIFLSNRIHPNQDNTKLISNNVRTDIQEQIYRALEEKE